MEAKLRPGNPYITTAVYYLSFIGLGLAAAVLGPTLQGLAKNANATLAQISSLFLICSFGYLLGSLTAGRVYDKVKGHPVLSMALLIIAALMVLVPLMRALLFLQVLFFIIGAAEGYLDVGANTLIVWLHGDRVPPFMNGLHAFYGMGSTLAPLIVAAVLSSARTLNSVYWALAILLLPTGLLMLLLPSPSLVRARQQAEERPAVPTLVFLATVVFFAITGAELGFGGWIYTFTTSQAYADPMLAANVNAAYWAAFTFGRLVSIPLAVKLKPRQILWVDFGGVLVSLLIIIFFSSSEVFLWLGTIGMGLFMASAFPTLLNDAQSRMHMSGKVTSMFFVGSSLGSMTLPWLMGQLIGPFGATAIMVPILGGVLLSIVVFYILSTKRPSTYTPPTQTARGAGDR